MVHACRRGGRGIRPTVGVLNLHAAIKFQTADEITDLQGLARRLSRPPAPHGFLVRRGYLPTKIANLVTRITVRQSVLPQILITKSYCLWSGGKNAESIRDVGLRGQRGQALCDEAVRMVNPAHRCGALRLRNAGFSDYPFITARLFKLVISHQTSRSAQIRLGRSLPGVAISEAEQDNKYAKRYVWPRYWISGHRRGDRRDDFVAVMKPHEAAPDSARLPAAKGGIGPPIRSPQ